MASQITTSIEHSSHKNGISNANAITVVNVAVAVIYHDNHYLLGFRDASQHQGNRYEFVGGKIESEKRLSKR